MRSSFLTGFLCCTALLAAHGADIHVDRWNGDNRNDGSSPALAVATLAHGVRLLKGGDRLILAPGPEPYYEDLRLRNCGGAAIQPTIIEGNGAILSGLTPMPQAEWTAKEGGLFWHPHPQRGALRPYLMVGERAIPKAPLDNLVADSHCWTTNGVWFRPAAGKSLVDYQLRGALRGSGVAINNASHIKVRNLTCERFANDGFNVHGACHGLIFENIVARYNGDDGFSIHEDVEAIVYGGHFYENDNGVQDINASQSVFHDILVENNHRAGMDMYGGYRGLFNSVVRNNNNYQISISSGQAPQLGFVLENPMLKGLMYIKNTEIYGRDTGVRVVGNSGLTMRSCTLRDLTTGVLVANQGVLHAVDTAVSNCSRTNLLRESNATVVWPELP